MTIDEVENEIYEVADRFPFISNIETLMKTPNTIKIKLYIAASCFIQIYQNIQKNVRNYVIVSGNQRLFGRDCDGGKWHCHPLDDPDSHDFSEDGAIEVSLEDFLYEAGEKLIIIGIL